MTSPTSSPSITAPVLSQGSLGSQPCSPSACCGRCPSDATDVTTAASNESASSESKNDSAMNTRDASDSFAMLRTLEVHRDNRGNVRETFRASWFPNVPPIKQLVRSKSKPKTLRGMHFHKRQWDIWHIVKGAALVRLYYHDDHEQAFDWLTPGSTLAIPPGVSHGFYTADGCILLYGLTEEYDGTDEFGWHFSDGLDAIGANEFRDEWPTDPSHLNISLRDLGAARLGEFRG